MIEMLIDIHCTLLKRDIIGVMNVGIEDTREILNSNKNNSRRLAISHLSDMFTDSDLNPLYDVTRIFLFLILFCSSNGIESNLILLW